jgi:hypothetical protein
MANRRLVVAQTRLAVDPAGIRPYWRAEPGGPPPPHPGREIVLPVGVVRWNNPTPTLSVVVKLTLSFGPDAERTEDAVWAEPVDPQPPLSGTQWNGDASLGKLVYPTDFVPFKKRADVLVSGHAYGEPPAPKGGLGEPEITRIRAGFAVDELTRTFTAVARGNTDRVALTPGQIKDRDEVGAADPTGPMPAPFVIAPQRWHKLDFDYTAYNAASLLQQPPILEPDAIIRLTRLSSRAEERIILLPNLVPRVFVQPPESHSLGELEMDCDMLFIDTDAETCTLLFRGDMPVDSVETPRRNRVVVSLEYVPDARDMEDILRELPRGLFFYAVEAGDVVPGAPPVPSHSSELQMARYETWGYPLAPLPTLPLAKYTTVSVELAEGSEGRAEVLRKHGIGDEDWTLEERAWSQILAQQGAAERGALATEAGRLTVEAQERFATPGEAERTLADFARVAVLVERLGTTRGLAEAKLSRPAWLRMGRRFRAATARDKTKKADLARLLEAERSKAAAALPPHVERG